MPARDVGFPVFDADNHMYETREALTKHLPDPYKGAIDYVDVHGRTKIMVRGMVSEYIPNPTFDRVGRPGALAEYFKRGNPDGKSQRELIGRGIDCLPAFRDPAARLALMDEQGVDYANMYPTLASLVEERMRDDPDLCAAAIHALNQWMHETWTFAYEGRIFPVPVITPGLVENAVAELEWVVDHGAHVVLMRPAPAWGYRGPRSFALPEFDPFWERVQDTGVLVVLHSSDTGYTRYTNEWEGTQSEALAFGKPRPFTAAVEAGHRDIQDAITSIICHGALWRFPRVRIAAVENGAAWVPVLLANLDHAHRQMPQEFPEHPAETFRRRVWVHPFHEEDPHELIDLVGPDHVIFGSDFPHVEGLAEPLSFLDEISDLADDDVRRIMGGNMLGLLGVPAAA